jgi:hypothetical protein
MRDVLVFADGKENLPRVRNALGSFRFERVERIHLRHRRGKIDIGRAGDQRSAIRNNVKTIQMRVEKASHLESGS